MEAVRAGWGLEGGSKFLYPQSCHCRNSANFPSLSNRGSCRSASLKTCDIQSRVALMDSDLMAWPVFLVQNLLQVEVGSEADEWKVTFVSRPSTKLLRVGSFDHGSFCGCFSSKHVTHEAISGGSGRITNPNGACSGKCDERRLQRWELSRWKSLERESVIRFFDPGNHWLYRQDSDS